MAYTVRKGKLHFVTRTGNGPCNRRNVGQPMRRHIRFQDDPPGWTRHTTKGRIRKDAPR